MSVTIQASTVMELREKTGAGMMDCKKALTEAGGDAEKAIEILRQKGLKKSAEKQSRVAKEGIVLAEVNADQTSGVMVELNCETDFVAKNTDFVKFAEDVLAEIKSTKPKSVEALTESPASYDSGKKVGETVMEMTAKIGEKIAIRRFANVETKSGVIAQYIHPGNKLGVLVELKVDGYAKEMQSDAHALAHDIAMQAAAMNPMCIRRDQIPAEAIEKEKAILIEQGKQEGKPEKVLENIVKGRLEKYYQEVCLEEQVFVKDGSKTIKDRLADLTKKLGKPVQIQSFERFRLGE